MNKALHWIATRRRSAQLRLLAVCLAAVLSGTPALARDVLAHFYAVNEPSSWESLRSNAAQVELLSPDWFLLDQQGQLHSAIDEWVLNWAKQRRLRLMPLLSNVKFDGQVVHALLQDESQQSALIRDLVEASRTNGFWGMQLDFENVAAADRDRYTQFVRNLAQEFRRHHLKLSIAVPAPLRPVPPAAGAPAASPWAPNERAAAFDYRELGRLADYVTLMTYDESVSEPGPIAGLPWVEACLRAALSDISRKKLLLGVALYYRHWTRPLAAPAGPYVVSEGAYPAGLQLATQWGARVELDPAQQELKVSHQDGVNTHQLWLGNAATLKQRLELVNKYRLVGFSAWRLGQEDPAIWQSAFTGLR